jgi:hypothetical protein
MFKYFPTVHQLVASGWTDTDGRKWLFQDPPQETPYDWDDSWRLAYVYTAKQEQLHRDDEYTLTRESATRQINVCRLFHKTGFKTWAIVQVV